jgi:hypothetical protein
MTTCAVLHVTSTPGGGVDRHIRDIVRSTSRTHIVWHASDSADVLETFRPRRFHPLAPRWSEAHGESLAAWLRGRGVGIVHAHSVARMPRARATWAARVLDAGLVATLHDVLFLREQGLDPAAPREADPAWLAQTSDFLARAKARLAPSEYLAQLARDHLPGQDIALVPNGSPAKRGSPVRRPVARPEFLERRLPRVAIVLGAIGPHKGARVLEEAAGQLAAHQICVVVVGYLDAQAEPGWRNAGLFVHGAYEDEAVAGLVAAYGGQIALFPNQVPESFSYALSDVWDAGLPALVPPEGALGERVARNGGGWLLPAGFGAAEIVAEVKRIFSRERERDLAALKLVLSSRDAQRVPSLSSMASTLDALYARYGLQRDATLDPGAAPAQELLATQLDGSLFRPELARVADEVAQLRAAIGEERAAAQRNEAEARRWIAKLEGDVKSLQAELAAEVEQRRRATEENAQLRDYKSAFDRLPGLLRRFLLRRARGARS